MTFIERFDELKKKYASKADISKLTDSFIAAQITMSDSDCHGTFYISFINGVLACEPYDYHDNTVAVIVNSLLLEDCIKGKADPSKEYLDGRIQAWGNLDHALMLIECLKGKKKAPAKKTKTAKAEKAEEVKAEAVKEEALKEEKKPAKKACKKTAEEKKEAPVKEEVKKAKKAPSKKTTKKEN